MKKHHYILGFAFLFIVLACNRDFDNPYDSKCPPEAWTPLYLIADTLKSNVYLNWEQPINHIDGFLIDRSTDSINWSLLTSSKINKDKQEYFDSTIIAGNIYYYRIYAIADKNTSNYCYSNKVVLPIQLPTVITNEIINISTSTAILKGEVISGGGTKVIERGFCLDTIPIPEITKYKINAGDGIGVFEANAEDLKLGTTYFVRAYAINSKGIAYGEQLIFKTIDSLAIVVTNNATDITPTSAIFSGEVINGGGSLITERGFFFSTTNNPDISTSNIKSGAGFGKFSSTVSDLAIGTTYYMRAYAINIKGTAYGEIRSFTTASTIATVVTTETKNINSTTATFYGEVTFNGGATVTERGFCYSTTSMPNINDLKVKSGNGIGLFSSDIVGLDVTTTYYVRAYAINNKGIAYGEQITFTTTASIATVVTNDVTDISTTTATFNGEVTFSGGATVTERGFCYSTTPIPDISESTVKSGAGTGIFSQSITDLEDGIYYYVRAYALNSSGIAYGNQIVFKTISKCLCDKSTYRSFLDTRDGRTYKTIEIGKQTWMAENLAYLPSINISTQRSTTNDCYYVYGYNGSSVEEAKQTLNYIKYGVLYNQPASTKSCPAGWHLPNENEWQELINYLTDNGYGLNGGNAIAMSLSSETDWVYNATEGTPGNKPEKNNLSCLTAHPAGYSDSTYHGIRSNAHWRSSNSGGYHIMSNSSLFSKCGIGTTGGMSVRCIKD